MWGTVSWGWGCWPRPMSRAALLSVLPGTCSAQWFQHIHLAGLCFLFWGLYLWLLHLHLFCVPFLWFLIFVDVSVSSPLCTWALSSLVFSPLYPVALSLVLVLSCTRSMTFSAVYIFPSSPLHVDFNSAGAWLFLLPFLIMACIAACCTLISSCSHFGAPCPWKNFNFSVESVSCNPTTRNTYLLRWFSGFCNILIQIYACVLWCIFTLLPLTFLFWFISPGMFVGLLVWIAVQTGSVSPAWDWPHIQCWACAALGRLFPPPLSSLSSVVLWVPCHLLLAGFALLHLNVTVPGLWWFSWAWLLWPYDGEVHPRIQVEWCLVHCSKMEEGHTCSFSLFTIVTILFIYF